MNGDVVLHNFQDQALKIQIYNLNGQLVSSINVDNSGEEFSTFFLEIPSGLYVVKVIGENEFATGKTVKP